MANENRINITLSSAKGGVNLINIAASNTWTLTGNQGSSKVQAIGTSTEQIVFDADQIAEGISYVAIINLDQTNYVQLSTDNASANLFAKLLPAPSASQVGGMAIYPIYNQAAAGSPAVYAKAHTGACNVLVVAFGIT